MIFEAMIQDEKDGHYRDALAKHIWFHDHAAALDPATDRLSGALRTWGELGKVYPPAMDKLRAARDAAATKVKASDPSALDAFREVAAINFSLEDLPNTRDLWIWVDQHDKVLAAQSISIAEPTLILLNEYKLINKSIEKPDELLTTYSMIYLAMLAVADNTQNPVWQRQSAKNQFFGRMSTLVALLVVNNRRAEAQRIAERITKELPDQEFAASLADALKGNVPRPLRGW